MPAGLSLARKMMLFATPFILVGAGVGGATTYYKSLDTVEAVQPLPETDGSRLYLQHCAYCHGTTGNGQGNAALNPSPRAFGYDKYKFSSVATGMPGDEDFHRVLLRGIPGSAMPSFNQLTVEQRASLIEYVRGLTKLGVFRFKWDRAVKGGDDPDAAEITAMLAELCRVGDPVAVPKVFADSTPESLERGKAIFTKNCANCHGPQGKGDGPQVKDPKFVNENGTPAMPRDLTTETFKGGREKSEVYKRIFLGIPGTPMPASNTMKPEEIQDLINYVLSLNPGAKP